MRYSNNPLLIELMCEYSIHVSRVFVKEIPSGTNKTYCKHKGVRARNRNISACLNHYCHVLLLLSSVIFHISFRLVCFQQHFRAIISLKCSVSAGVELDLFAKRWHKVIFLGGEHRQITLDFKIQGGHHI